jgi:hypothetical protein
MRDTVIKAMQDAVARSKHDNMWGVAFDAICEVVPGFVDLVDGKIGERIISLTRERDAEQFMRQSIDYALTESVLKTEAAEARIAKLEASIHILRLEKDISDIGGSLMLARYDEQYRGKYVDPLWEQSARTVLKHKERDLAKARTASPFAKEANQ